MDKHDIHAISLYHFPLLLLVLLIGFMASGGVLGAVSQQDFVDTWVNDDPNTGGMTRLIIEAGADTMIVHGYGKCHPTDCDWGTVSAPYTGNPFTAVYEFGFKTDTLTIELVSENALHVHSVNIFHDGTNRDYEADYYMHRESVTQSPDEDCVSFNPDTTTVVNIQGSWRIVDGNHSMFDFGSNESEAKRSLEIIKHYGMNQSCFVGRPEPSFQYLLVSGHSPSGSLLDEDCVSFNLDNITVEQIQGRWKIVDGDHWMFDFGNNESEAKQSFKIIKHHGFTYSCFVGRPDPSFQYLRTDSSIGDVTCPPATLSQDMKIHIPVLHYTPLLVSTPLVLWADLELVDINNLRFEVTNYGVVVPEE
jgi:hypothetical protein